MHTLALALICVGVAALAQFGSLAFAARQLAGVSAPALRQRMASPLVRHAVPLAGLAGVVLLAGLVLYR